MSWLYMAPLGLVVTLVVLPVLGALDAGHRLSRIAPVAEQQVTNVSVPILAIVGLLLAFAFGMAGDRHARRREAAVAETNSIGTFWLRTSLVTEPVKSEMRSRLRRYVDLHFEHRDAGIDLSRTAALEAEATRLQDELWRLFDQEAHRAPETSNMVLLVAPALNAMIDDAAVLLAARENRVPDAVILYLFLLIVVAGLVIGYRPRDEKRNLILWGFFLVVLGGTLVILLDLDRPRRGLIQTDTAIYLRLRDSMRDP